MELVIKIKMNEIVQLPEHTVYNHIHWKFTKRTAFGITHVIEKYDDVNDNPEYLFYCGDKYFATGYGDPIPTEKLGFGGVYVEANIIDACSIK